jgi:HEAT repeat protein
LPFSASSEFQLQLAFAVGAISLVVAIGLALQVLAMRVRGQRLVQAAPVVGLADARPLIGLGAARALIQIHPVHAVPAVLAQYLQRPDWPAPRVATLLRHAGAEAVAPPLNALLTSVPADDQLRLLPLLRFAESPNAGSVLYRLIESSEDPRVLSAALRQLHGPESLPRVRALAHHADALVRSAAAVALARVGSTADRPLLAALMSDRDWWVRYRAAQAQLRLPGGDASVIAALRQALTDRYAIDMLDHVLAERALEAMDASWPGRAVTA